MEQDKIIDIDMFKSFPPGTVFAKGITTNDPKGAYMTDCNVGERLKFVAKKGFGFDWAIYVLWASMPYEYIETNGDKVETDEYIQNIVPCTEEVLKLYRK